MNRKINSNFEKTELKGMICGVNHSFYTLYKRLRLRITIFKRNYVC